MSMPAAAAAVQFMHDRRFRAHTVLPYCNLHYLHTFAAASCMKDWQSMRPPALLKSFNLEGVAQLIKGAMDSVLCPSWAL